VLHILDPEPATSPLIAFGVLGFAAFLEGWSVVAALTDFNKARRGTIWQEIRSTKDAPTLVLLLENSGALVGLAFAGAGLGLSLITANPMWDGLASVLIGLVLGVLAVVLLYEAKGLLIGESADPDMVVAIRDCAAAHKGIIAVHEVLTLHSAPTMVTTIISADFEDTMTARDVERIVLEIERQVAERFPIVARVYVRPRDSSAGQSSVPISE